MQADRLSEVLRSLVLAPFEFQMLRQGEMSVRLAFARIRQPKMGTRSPNIEGMLAL